MGLKEKKAIANLNFGYSERRLKESTGKEIKIELDTPSFLKDINAISNADAKGADKVAAGIIDFCRIEIKKDSFINKNISKIILRHQQPGNRNIKYENGILKVSFSFNHDEYFSDSEVRKILEGLI